jgi:hypothetical protein
LAQPAPSRREGGTAHDIPTTDTGPDRHPAYTIASYLNSSPEPDITDEIAAICQLTITSVLTAVLTTSLLMLSLLLSSPAIRAPLMWTIRLFCQDPLAP